MLGRKFPWLQANKLPDFFICLSNNENMKTKFLIHGTVPAPPDYTNNSIEKTAAARHLFYWAYCVKLRLPIVIKSFAVCKRVVN
jgi:hypothetical protein